MNWESVRRPIAGWVAFAILSLCVCDPAAFCQRAGNPLYGTTPGAIPLVNVGGGPTDAQFFALDFAQKILAQQNKNTSQQERERQQALVDSGAPRTQRGGFLEMHVRGSKVILRERQTPEVQKRPGKPFVEIRGGLELGLCFCRVVAVEISRAEVIVGRDELGDKRQSLFGDGRWLPRNVRPATG